MVLPIEAIEAAIDIPELVEIRPGQKVVRIVYRATLRNTGDETRVLHSPSTDHGHFWHLFDADLNELDRERGAGRGGEKGEPNPKRFRGLTLGPGQEVHDTKTIRVDSEKVLGGAGRFLLRVDLWGQSTEAEFHTVVRPARLTPAKAAAKKAAAKKKAPKKAAAKKKAGAKKKVAARKKATVKKSGAKKRPVKRRASARKTVAKKKPTARKAAPRKKTARKSPARRK